MIGRTVTHYRIQEKLGGGGMGVVYRAEDLKLGRTVALKFLPPETVRDDEAKRRFFHEARAAAALDHPNICTVYEVDETPEGEVFLAMACYDGETLKDRIARGPLPTAEAVRIALRACDGLVRAHQRGIVHRDIKPANIMLTADGTVKIVDFGLAKLAGQTALTRTGTTLGTVTYMAPEQARGAAVDGRADVWALGAVLYEMLTGRPPFAGEYAQAVIYSILNEAPEQPSHLRSDLPAALETVIARALAKDPEQRVPGVAELAAALRALGLDPSTSPPLAETQPLVVTPGTASGAQPAGSDEGASISAGMARPRPPWWLYAAAIPFVCYTLFMIFQYFFGLESPGFLYSRSDSGILLTEVSENSAAVRAGLQAGDRIVTVDGHPASWDVMRHFYFHAEGGREYRLEYVRQKIPRTATLVLGPVPWRYWLSQDGLNELGHIFISLVFIVLAVLIPSPAQEILWPSPAPSGWPRGASPSPGCSWGCRRVSTGSSVSFPFRWRSPSCWPRSSPSVFPPSSVSFSWHRSRGGFSRRAGFHRAVAVRHSPVSHHGVRDIEDPLFDHSFRAMARGAQVFGSIRALYWIGAICLLIYSFRTLRDKNERRRLRLLFIGFCAFSSSAYASLSAPSGCGSFKEH